MGKWNMFVLVTWHVCNLSRDSCCDYLFVIKLVHAVHNNNNDQ